MANIRIGLGSEFNLKDQKLGLGTDNPQTRLDVAGSIRSKDLNATGVSSFTAYSGFLRADHQIVENTTLNFDQGPSASLSGEIIVGTGKTVTVNEVVKETAGVGNNGNTLWHNLVAGGHSGVIDRSPADKGAFWNGEYFDLDGSNDVITGESCLTLFTDNTDHTIEMWVKFDDVTTRRTIISGYKSGDADRWDLEINGGKIKGGHHVTGYFTSTASVVTGTWYHLVFVNDHASSLWRLFINTATDVTNSNGGADLTSDIALGIGDRVDSSIGHLDGQISIVRIYSKELSSTEISANYNLGPFSKDTSVTGNLITHYNASNPSSYPGTVRDVDTTDFTRAGGSEIECLKVYNTFTPPAGGTNDRPYAPKPGELYYNYDFKTIEFFDGNGWRQVDNMTRSGRMIYGGSSLNPYYQVMHYVNIHTTGNSIDFGSLLIQRYGITGSCSSDTRGLAAGGWTGSSTDTIEYFTMASGGTAIDFGNLIQAEYAMGSCSSSTRGLFAGSYQAPSNTRQMEYVEIATLGNALDFGDMSGVTRYGIAGLSSPTRGIFAGGRAKGELGPYSGNAATTEIDLVTIASKGDSTDFGDQTFTGGYGGGLSNTTRGIIGGSRTPAGMNNIDYITIASTGNAKDFGDLTNARAASQTGATQTRGVFVGGSPTADTQKTIDYITISSSGNAIDFGESGFKIDIGVSVSDSHGGLGGF